MEDSERKARFLLSHIKGIGPNKFRKVLHNFHTASKFINLSFSSLSRFCGDSIAKQIREYVYDFDTEIQLKKLENQGIKVIVFGEENYPSNLSYISDAPLCLYAKGQIQILNSPKIFSIVGTRKISDYGKKITTELVRALSSEDVMIVSGMAFGVDAFAHKICCEMNKPSVAVLASSCDNPTPASNTYIYKSILENEGVILSENPPGFEIGNYSFPCRNRIIAGLSLGTIVIEAGEKSGALITANFAFSEGRQVFAVPGDIYRSTSKGTNSLIKNSKAKLIENAEDILIEFGFSTIVEQSYHYTPSNKEEEMLLTVLQNQPLSIEEIIGLTSLSLDDILRTISNLEIQNIISRNSEGQYLLSAYKS